MLFFFFSWRFGLRRSFLSSCFSWLCHCRLRRSFLFYYLCFLCSRCFSGLSRGRRGVAFFLFLRDVGANLFALNYVLGNQQVVDGGGELGALADPVQYPVLLDVADFAARVVVAEVLQVRAERVAAGFGNDQPVG